ncbi:hypothetical protein [Kribbella pratensis]|uniref:hypothetical protein n=1 Tax=Kribbella pratensis TaxID=2512112 RepID=UPI001065F838|nr:hypothetical protein [Kribbella pratensis]
MGKVLLRAGMALGKVLGPSVGRLVRTVPVSPVGRGFGRQARKQVDRVRERIQPGTVQVLPVGTRVGTVRVRPGRTRLGMLLEREVTGGLGPLGLWFSWWLRWLRPA